jgi:hypothetical protein
MFSVRYVFWGIARPTKKAASVNCDATNPKSKFLEFFFGFGKKLSSSGMLNVVYFVSMF